MSECVKCGKVIDVGKRFCIRCWRTTDEYRKYLEDYIGKIRRQVNPLYVEWAIEFNLPKDRRDRGLKLIRDYLNLSLQRPDLELSRNPKGILVGVLYLQKVASQAELVKRFHTSSETVRRYARMIGHSLLKKFEVEDIINNIDLSKILEMFNEKRVRLVIEELV